VAADEGDLGEILATVKASPRAYWAARGRAISVGLIALLAFTGFAAARMALFARGLWGGALAVGLMVTICVGFGFVIAVALLRAVVEVHAGGLVLSGGFVRRAFPNGRIGRVALVNARYGENQRKEVQVFDSRGNKLHSVIGEFFDLEAVRRALAELGRPVEDGW
jgi:putative heme degradation protein